MSNSVQLINGVLIMTLIVVGLCGFHGYRKGVLRMIFGLVSWIFMVLLVMFGTPYMNQVLTDHTGIDEKVHEKMVAYAEKKWDEKQNDLLDSLKGEEGSVLSGLPEDTGEEGLNINTEGQMGLDVNLVIEGLEMQGVEVPDSLKEKLTSLVDGTGGLSGILGKSISDTGSGVAEQAQDAAVAIREQAIESMADTMTAYMMRGISMIVISVLGAVIIGIVSRFVRLADRTLIIGGASHMIGLALGLAVGILYVSIFFYIVRWFPWTETGSGLLQQITANPLTNYMYVHNPLDAIGVLVMGDNKTV